MDRDTFQDDLPFWRSLLFIPTNNKKFVDKANTRGADAIILDLEDSIDPSQKEFARLALPTAAQQIARAGTDVVVRINSDSIESDITAACTENISAIVVPKVNDKNVLLAADKILKSQETQQELPIGKIRLLAQIEDVKALVNLDQIACSTPRLMGMSLGSEDFSASARMSPTKETLYWPNLQVAFACRRAEILPFGFPDSIALIKDVKAMTDAAKLAANMGMVGAFCIHPTQVSILNNALTPSELEVSKAKLLLSEYMKSKTQGQAVFVFEGKMVDLPVVNRAKETITRAEALSKYQSI